MKRTIHIFILFCAVFFCAELGYGQGKWSEPLSLVKDTSLSTCQNLIKSAESFDAAGQYQQAYDGYRAYIESCAYLSNSWTHFIDIGAANSARSGDYARFQEYREWLKKVLYYSLDTNYYCADVGQLLSTFSWFNNTRGRDWRGMITVEKYIAASGKCPKATAYYDTVVIPGNWHGLYQAWLDSVQNPDLTPFDSTLPSLEDLDLGILRGPPADVKKFIDSKLGPIISNIYSMPNPFTSETKISFITREAVALKFEVFDVLGRSVYSTEKVYDQGDDQIILPGSSLPHGELYGRFSASDGTVKTMKLIHE